MNNYRVNKLTEKLIELTEDNILIWERITHDILHENKYRVTFFRELYEGYAMDFKMSYYANFENGFLYIFLITNKLSEDFFTLAIQSNSKALLTPLNKESDFQTNLIMLHETIVKKSENVESFLTSILNYQRR
ncbi:MAG: hypothetical protein APF84_11805 [Gracilibacter sp. BRH_c7a]|nr:MAG: hypothetical protein APF84_11805 [Gracilibacter sp. BRH_c7a]